MRSGHGRVGRKTPRQAGLAERVSPPEGGGLDRGANGFASLPLATVFAAEFCLLRSTITVWSPQFRSETPESRRPRRRVRCPDDLGQRGLDGLDNAHEIDLDHGIEALGGHRPERGRSRSDAGVGHDDVEPAEPLNTCGVVRCEADRARFVQMRGGSLRRRIEIDDHDRGAARDEPSCRFKTDSPRGARPVTRPTLPFRS